MKHIIKNTCLAVLLLLLILATISCEKFLDEKQDNKFTIPQSLNDLQLLLDSYTIMNSGYPVQQEVAADNYYLTTADYNALTDNTFRNYYSWQKDDLRMLDWNNTYRSVLYANTVLEEAPKFIHTEQDEKIAGPLKGAAFFYRANAFLIVAQVFAPTYDSSLAATQSGIPLRLTADINAPTTRASVQQTYQQILADFKMAAALLDTLQKYSNRPTRQAAFAGLARCLLIMGNYQQAALYADSALQLKSDLINFNTISSSASNPFPRFNKEVIFPCISGTAQPLTPARAKIDTTLFAQYLLNDLRRTLFFKKNSNGSYAFKGDYNASNNGSTFLGYTTGELYLIKAECYARLGDLNTAMDALNTLMVTRWRTGTFTPFTALSYQQAIDTILAERRKELCFRGLRWSDLRRLNKNTATQTILTRFVNNQFYNLPPGSPRFTFQLPLTVIELSGIDQNP